MAKKAKQPGGNPPSIMASAVVSGWVQFVALVIGLCALAWSIYTYYVPAQAFAEGRGHIELAAIEEDFKQIATLHRAVDHVSAYEIGHVKFVEAEPILGLFKTTRLDVLRRHSLVAPFTEFCAAFDAFKKSPTAENQEILLAAAKKFASLLDAATQQMGRKRKT